MIDDDVLAEFRDAGALLDGHFILSSGLRSPVLLQKMFVFQDPARTERLCKAPDKLPPELATIPPVKPGSRGLSA
jgi:orotate phosphoribosyltransferase